MAGTTPENTDCTTPIIKSVFQPVIIVSITQMGHLERHVTDPTNFSSRFGRIIAEARDGTVFQRKHGSKTAEHRRHHSLCPTI